MVINMVIHRLGVRIPRSAFYDLTPPILRSVLLSPPRVACGLERLAPERQGPSRHPEKESRY